MANNLQGAIDYARSHPTRDGGSWAGWCASFVYRAGGFSRAFENAMSAGDASGPLDGANWGAPPGAIHYWAGVGGDGHCAFELGNNLLLMASSSVTDSWGVAVGTVDFAHYARLGIPYRGWSMGWGGESLSGAGVSVGSVEPIDDGIFASLSQYDQEYTRNNTVVAVETLRRIEATLGDLADRFAVPGMPFDWFPALNNNIGSVFAAVQAIAKTQLDDSVLTEISAQVSVAVAGSIAENVKNSVIAAIPNRDAFTKADLVEIVDSLSITVG